MLTLLQLKSVLEDEEGRALASAKTLFILAKVEKL